MHATLFREPISVVRFHAITDQSPFLNDCSRARHVGRAEAHDRLRCDARSSARVMMHVSVNTE